MKRYLSIIVIALFSFFFSISNGYAKLYTPEELGNEVHRIAEENGTDATYYYVIGNYVFTSEDSIQLSDFMIAARSINITKESGRTDKDPIYNEMTTYQYNNDFNDDWEFIGYYKEDNFTGTTEEPEEFDIKYIDYNSVDENGINITDNILDTIDKVNNRITKNYKNNLKLENITEKIVSLDELDNKNTEYFYVIGEYIFTSKHKLTIEDLMIGSTTIEVSDDAGYTKKDKIYDELVTQLYDADYDDNWEFAGFIYKNNFTGDVEPVEGQDYNIHFVDYKDVVNFKAVRFMDDEEEYAYKIVKSTGKIDVPANPTKEGLTFDGWYDSDNNKVDVLYGTFDKSTTLYAKYVGKVDTYALISNNLDHSNSYVLATTKSDTSFSIAITPTGNLENTQEELVNIIKDIVSQKEVKEISIIYNGTEFVFDSDVISGTELIDNVSVTKTYLKIIDIATAIGADQDDIIGTTLDIKVTLNSDTYKSLNNNDSETYQIDIEQLNGAIVKNEEELDAVLANDDVDIIYVIKDFSIKDTSVVTKNTSIYGLGHTITLESDTDKDVLIAKNQGTELHIHDLHLTGGEYGIHLMDEADLMEYNKLNVTGNTKGGILVEKDSQVVSFHIEDLIFENESYNVPAVRTVTGNVNVLIGSAISDQIEDENGEVIEIRYFVTSTAVYTVTFNVDGNKWYVSKVIHGELVPKPEVDPVKENYDFVQWLYGDIDFDFNKPANNNLNMNAQFKKHPEVSFEVDGEVVDKVFVKPGFTVAQPADPEKVGYSFVEWTINKNEQSVTYDFEDEVNRDITLVAKFSKDPEVTFMNGDILLNKVSVKPNEKVIEPEENPTKDGYTFVKWVIETENGTEEYDFESAVTQDIIIKAEFVKDPEVSFMVGETRYHFTSVKSGSKVLAPEIDPSKDGYTFVKWVTEDESEEFDFETNITEDTIIKAMFSKDPVVLFMNGENKVKDISVKPNELAVEPTEIPETDEQHYFLHWGYENEDGDLVAFDFTTPITKDITLIAIFETKPTVTFRVDGNEDTVLYVNIGDKVEEPEEKPTKEGYYFLNWGYENEDGELVAFDFDNTISSNIVLQPIFIENPKVTFKVEGKEDEIVTVDYLSLVTKPADPTVEGKTFVKWVIIRDENEVDFDFEESYVSRDITLVAKFIED